MKTAIQIKELYNTGIVNKCDNFYYKTCAISPTVDDIMAANDLHMAFTEWWEVYHSRSMTLKENSINNGIPLISHEDCVNMGL